MSILLHSNSGLVRSGLAAHYDFFKTNLLLHSAQMDDASWIRNLVTVTADAETAPDGNVSADLLAPTDANSFMRQSVSAVSNEDYTFSVYLKSPGADRTLRISLRDPSLGLLADLEIVVTSSWQRFQLTANSGANTQSLCRWRRQ